jgi:hypothetical protein
MWGAQGDVKQWSEWFGRRRVIEFYVNTRLDRLKLREEVLGVKAIEYYEARADRLIYRSAAFSADRWLNNLAHHAVKNALQSSSWNQANFHGTYRRANE